MWIISVNIVEENNEVNREKTSCKEGGDEKLVDFYFMAHFKAKWKKT